MKYSQVLHNQSLRIISFLILCLLYSLFKDDSVSTFLKPLPIIFCLLVLLNTPRIVAAKWLVYSLSCAIIGDILLDLGENWVQIGALPFLASTALMAIAFHIRLSQTGYSSSAVKQGVILIMVATPFLCLFNWLTNYSTEAVITGGVLFSLSVILITTAIANLLFNKQERPALSKPVLGLLGTSGIVANYVLFSIDLYVAPVPRDLVIQVYYWGTALVVWSFTK